MSLPPVLAAESALGGGLSPIGAVEAEAGVSKKFLSHPEMVVEMCARCGMWSRNDVLARILASSRFQSSRFFDFLCVERFLISSASRKVKGSWRSGFSNSTWRIARSSLLNWLPVRWFSNF